MFLEHEDGAPQYMGLYTVSEVPHKPLLADQFDGDEGSLYKCDGLGAQFAEFHPESFHQKTNKSDERYAEVQAFIEALNATPDKPEVWRADLEVAFDVDGFLRFWALNQVIVNWDTYGALAHNYYLYADPLDDGRLAWIGWDFDLSFEGESDLAMTSYGVDWPLLHRVAQDPVYMERYRALLAEALEGPLAQEAVVAEIERLRALVEPYVVGEMGERPYFTSLPSEHAFAEGIERLIEHIETQRELVGVFLAE